MLRHYEVEGLDLPRPLRSWNEGEFGIEGLTEAERKQVKEDDILMFRFLTWYIVSEEVRKAQEEEKPVDLLLEQPAIPHLEEVVSWWKTPQWRRLERIYGLGPPSPSRRR